MLALVHVLLADAHARELHGRVAVGFEDQLAATSDGGALSARYWLPTASGAGSARAPMVGAELSVGLDVREGGAGPSVGGRVLYAFLLEDNLNLVASGGVAWVGATRSLRLQPALGAEFFLFGLENLGISAEWGVNVDVGESFALTTPGNSVAGVRYYF
jgi:hypothetical protein